MKSDKDAGAGPLFRIFNNPIARVLDEARRVGSAEQTISALSDATKLDYKTVKAVLCHLIQLSLVNKTRKVGNAQVYQFDVENKLSPLQEWASRLGNEEANETMIGRTAKEARKVE